MKCKDALSVIIIFTALMTSVPLFAKPLRIVSLNLCADQLLIPLLTPAKLVGITQLASNPEVSYHYLNANQYHQHTSRIEEIMALKPDLIIAGEYTAEPTNQLLENLGFKVITLGLPVTMDGVFQQITFLGEQISEQKRAAKLIRQMRDELASLHIIPKEQQKRAVVYYANGYTAGQQTIVNAILTLAGVINVAAELNIDFVSPLSLEQLLASKPDILLLGRHNKNTDSLAHQVLQHKALKQYTALNHEKKIMVPDRYWTCAGPSSITAAAYIQQNLIHFSY